MSQEVMDALADAETLRRMLGERGNPMTDHAVRTRGAVIRLHDAAAWMTQSAAHDAFYAVPALRGA